MLEDHDDRKPRFDVECGPKQHPIAWKRKGCVRVRRRPIRDSVSRALIDVAFGA